MSKKLDNRDGLWCIKNSHFVSVTISRGDRKYRHNSEFDKAFLCRLETMFYEITNV